MYKYLGFELLKPQGLLVLLNEESGWQILLSTQTKALFKPKRSAELLP